MKRIAIYVYILLAGLISTSCEDFIDLSPQDKISTDDYWYAASDLENYMVQFYPNLASTDMVHYDAGHSDDMVYANLSDILNGQRIPATGNWIGEWAPIRNVNVFLIIMKSAGMRLSSISIMSEKLIFSGHGFTSAFLKNMVIYRGIRVHWRLMTKKG